MPVAQHILFPVDFSVSSAVIAPAVVAVATRLQAPVVLLHAGGSGAAGDLERLNAFAAKHLAGVAAVECASPAGASAARAIVQFAQSLAKPIIMMPTRGESGFRSLLLGSVTAAVLHDADCPVWTSAHCEDGGPMPTAYRSVVCAVDLGDASGKVVEQAMAFAAAFGAQLHLVHSVPGIDPRFASATADRAHAFLMAEAREAFQNLVLSMGRELPPLEIVEEVGLTDGVVAATIRHGADLLVIGRGVMQGVVGRLRTNAHEMIRQSRCPVLSV